MATEKFDYEGVKAKMTELEDLFERFGKRLSEINLYVNENVDVGPGSAIFGDAGYGALTSWNENASTFGDFKANFDKWSQLVTIISMNNMQFEGETFRTTGGTLSGVQTARETLANDMADDIISKSVVDTGSYKHVTVVTAEGTTVTTYNQDGTVLKVVTTTTDVDGNTVTITKTEGIITTVVTSAAGVALSRTSEYYCGYKSVRNEDGTISYYDATGKQISATDFNMGITGNTANGNFLENEALYVHDATVTTYGESIVNNIQGTAESVIDTGASYSMSQGTSVVGNDGRTYYFCGMATAGQDSGVKYFSISDPRTGSSSAQLFIIDDAGKVTPTNLAVGMLASNSDAQIVTTVRTVNNGLNISNLVVNNGDSKWAVTQQYIEAMEGSTTGVSSSSQLGDILGSRSSFTLAEGKQLTETDYRNSTSSSDVFYNSTEDLGVTSDTYYHDRNDDNIVASYEVWEGKGTQDAFEKAIERGDNKKKTSGYLFDVENK
ncbi:MAG: hypothetical protein IJ475_02955 [Bacilli bacterium]|nr:hypothetical protein [Bacilli bacterium]